MPRCMGESLNKCRDGPQEWVGEKATTSKEKTVWKEGICCSALTVKNQPSFFIENNAKLRPWLPHSFQNAPAKCGLLLMWLASNTKLECMSIPYWIMTAVLRTLQETDVLLTNQIPCFFFFFILRPQSPDLATTLGVHVLNVWGRVTQARRHKGDWVEQTLWSMEFRHLKEDILEWASTKCQ